MQKRKANDWEQRKLLDCIEKVTDFRGRTPKKLGMDWSESGYLALSALNVKDGYIDFMQDVHYGNQELYDKWMTGNELHKGQVLFTTEAPMGNVAQVPDNRRYILSQRTIAFDVKEDLITENFLATILRSPNVIAKLTALSSGGTAKGVSQKSLSKVEIIIPSDLEEQEQLANTFLELDHLITLHQCKCKIQYAGKRLDWEQRKLGEVIKEYKEIVDSECTLPVLTSSKTEGVILQEEHFGRKQQHDITGYNILPKDYCTYRNRSDGVDFTFNINKCCDKGIISKFYPVFCGNHSDVFFLSLVLNNSDEVVREIAYTCTGTGQKVLSFLDLQKIKVRVPKFDEQKKIADYFDSLNNLITLHQRKQKRLKLLLKSCEKDITTEMEKIMVAKKLMKRGKYYARIRIYDREKSD